MPLVRGSPGAPTIAGTPKSSSQSVHGAGGSGFCIKPATWSTFLRKGTSPNWREDAHRRHEEGAAAIQVILDHDLLLGVESVVGGGRVGKAIFIHAVVDDVINHPPHDDRERLQVGELGRAAFGDFPMSEAEAGGSQRIGVSAIGNDGRTVHRVVGIHQQDRWRGDGDETEIQRRSCCWWWISRRHRTRQYRRSTFRRERVGSAGPNDW